MAIKNAPLGEPSWDGLLRRSLDFECRAINEEERSFEVIASTDTLDSHGDIVEQTFDLKRYKKNPVVLWLHNSFGWFDGSDAEDFLPIGKAEGVKIEDGKLVAKIVLLAGTAAEEPLVDKIWRRIQQGVLRAVSIGFRPGKVTREENADTGKVTYRLSKNELYEISVVPIPSNPDAVAKSIAFEREQLRRLAANETAREREEESNMDPKELQAQLDKVKGELAVANANLEKAESAVKSETEKSAARVKELEDKVSGLELKCSELTTQCKQLTEQNAKYAAAEEANAKAVAESEVDALVGKKIAPTAREKWLAIRLRSKSEFEGLLEDMPELPHLKDITPPAPANTSGDLNNLIEEAKGA
jgi:HK97 family phage prohead protease